MRSDFTMTIWSAVVCAGTWLAAETIDIVARSNPLVHPDSRAAFINVKTLTLKTWPKAVQSSGDLNSSSEVLRALADALSEIRMIPVSSVKKW